MTATERHTRAQRQVIESHGVVFVGYDAKGRPVVKSKSPWGTNWLSWSLTKTGEATDISEPVTPAADSGGGVHHAR